MVDVREEAVERVRLGALARVEVDRQRRELAAVERLPRRDRRPPRVERLLLTLRQDVRLLLARDPQAVRVRLELGRREQRVGRGVVEGEPLEIDEEEKALEVGEAVAGERREIVRLLVGRLGVLARRRVEPRAGDVLVERVELGEEREQLRRRRRSRPFRAAASAKSRARARSSSHAPRAASAFGARSSRFQRMPDALRELTATDHGAYNGRGNRCDTDCDACPVARVECGARRRDRRRRRDRGRAPGSRRRAARDSRGAAAPEPAISIRGTRLNTVAPAFTLTDQFGKKVSLRVFRGKVVVLSFNDPECTTICPLTTTAMLEAKKLLGPAAANVQLLGVGANPEATGVKCGAGVLAGAPDAAQVALPHRLAAAIDARLERRTASPPRSCRGRSTTRRRRSSSTRRDARRGSSSRRCRTRASRNSPRCSRAASPPTCPGTRTCGALRSLAPIKLITPAAARGQPPESGHGKNGVALGPVTARTSSSSSTRGIRVSRPTYGA